MAFRNFFYNFFGKNGKIDVPAPFIVGVGRSGTTLLRAMLDTHPDLVIPPETGFIPALVRLRGKGDALRELFYKTVIGFETWEDLNFDKEDFHERLRGVKNFALADGVRCFYRFYVDQSQKKRWGDKTPVYGLHMRTIERLLPEAHFIHIIRDGRDVALSMKGLWWAPGKDMGILGTHWRETIHEIRKQGRRCRRYLEIRYEDLVQDTTKCLMKICGFINLPYAESMERYYEFTHKYLEEVKTRRDKAGNLLVTKEGRIYSRRFLNRRPDISRIGRWRSGMSADEKAQFDAVAGALLRKLGYKASF